MDQQPESESLVEGVAPPAGEAVDAASANGASANGAPTNGASAPKPKKHKARIEHKLPGRIRMKVPAAKSNPEILEVYRQAFSMVPGIIKVKAKPETGSIVIHYDPEQEKKFEHHFNHCCGQHLGEVSEGPRPDNEVAEIASRIEAEAAYLAERSEFAKTTVEFFKNCDRELKRATDNTIDLKIVLAGGLAAFTFLEIGAEAATPMWVTLALFSLNQFAELQHQDPSRAAAQPG